MTGPVLVLGHRGMVGSALVRALGGIGRAPSIHITGDLRESDTIGKPFKYWTGVQDARCIFLAAARVGGIEANRAHPGEFIRDNLLIQTHVLRAAKEAGAKLLFLGSSCMYPRDCPQPMQESDLLTGPPESTNRAYAIAKIAGMEMVRAYRQQYGCKFITVIPCNLYGTNDHYEPERAHVIPSLIRRFVEAKKSGADSVTVWGSGTARREFMHVDDCAEACLFLMDRYDSDEPINVGTGADVRIEDLALTIAAIVGYEGSILFDLMKPDGAPRKLLDVSRVNALGWTAKIGLEEGLRRTVAEYMEGRA